MTSTTPPLWQWSACDLAQATTAGEISASDAVSSAIARMRETNPHLNAVVDDRSEAALAEAEALDRHFQADGPKGPLHGVPVTIKVNVDQTGHATTNGVSAYRDVIAPDDAPVVRNLTNAGAVVIGRTNTPEFSFRATTVNDLHGRTRNPWDDEISPGGSSGGASSAVMAGMGAIAHGNDIGGSLRFPAWCTGAATVKPGLGRVPAYNPSAPAERGMLAQIMSVQGPICREVRDVRLAMRSMVAYDPHDPWQVPMPFDGPEAKGPIRVAFTKNMHEFALDPAVSAALDQAAEALSAAGYDVTEAEPPGVRETAEEAARCLFGETLELLGGEIDRHGSAELQSIFANYAKLFEPYRGRDLLLAMARRARHARAWSVFLSEWPLVLTPFMPTLPFRWDRDTEGMDGVREVLGAAIYSYSMNYLGLPAGNVPALLHENRPVGVQVIGQRFREDLILDACEVIEERAGIMARKLWSDG